MTWPLQEFSFGTNFDMKYLGEIEIENWFQIQWVKDAALWKLTTINGKIGCKWDQIVSNCNKHTRRIVLCIALVRHMIGEEVHIMY